MDSPVLCQESVWTVFLAPASRQDAGVADKISGARRVQAARHRLLDGKSAWGVINVRVGDSGVAGYQLVVYPPGISPDERRRLRVWRAWPLLGLLLWTGGEFLLGTLRQSFSAQAVLVAVVLGSGVCALSRAGSIRARVRTMSLTVAPPDRCDPDRASRNEVRRLAALLLAADQRLRRGEISAVDHELIWWRLYDRMAPERAADSRQGVES